MILKKVTFTGVDKWTSLNHLQDIWNKNQYIEWGFLYSERAMGVEKRYPTKQEIIDFIKNNNMNRSLHLCGSVVRQILEFGKFDYDVSYLITLFNRVQLNFNLNRSKLNIIKFFASIDNYDKTFILQVNDNNKQFIDSIAPFVDKEQFHYLFDASGGVGIELKEIPKPIEGKICGWAGGLNPENLESKLIQLEKELPKDLPIWIDMETGVRTDDFFDLSKVEQCCDIINKFNDSH